MAVETVPAPSYNERLIFQSFTVVIEGDYVGGPYVGDSYVGGGQAETVVDARGYHNRFDFEQA